MIFKGDIDIDLPDRNAALAVLKHVPAAIQRGDDRVKHNSGIYITDIPTDHNGVSTIDYRVAEERGYQKIDLLNVSVYTLVRDEKHLLELMNTEPPWHRLYEREFCAKLIHMGNHYDTLIKMPEAVDSIPKLAMMIAVIRPAKRHLIGKPWDEVAKTIWDKPTDGSYAFKKSHSLSYSMLVAVHMHLLDVG